MIEIPKVVTETKPCGCGKKMILCGASRMTALLSFPPRYQREWKCYGCGARAPAPDYKPPTAEEMERQMWRAEWWYSLAR